MSDIFSVTGSDIFNASGQNSAQRTQLAQYAILKASQYMQGGRQEDAIKAFKQALAFDPQNNTALTYIGNINLSLGNNAEAIKAFKQLAQSQPSSVDAQMSLGNAYLQDKQYSESEKVYQKAAKLAPTNPLPVYTLGMQYMNTNRLSEASDMFNEAQRLAPADGNVYYALGALDNKQGNYADAAKNLETAIALKPNFPAARYELGAAYSNLGQTDKANAQLTVLANAGSTYATDLYNVLDKPKILSMDVASNSKFNLSLGAQSPLWYFDASFLTPNQSNVVSITIQFDRQMDTASVSNPNNWSIGKATGGIAGYYNNGMGVSGNEVNISSTPLTVAYDASSNQATVSFMLNQNSQTDATIDPSHIVFKFSGVDASGSSMDSSSDQIDGNSGTAF